ncbi:MAG TPA: glycosyltransferase family 1 protein [Chloroflexi bacterium]|nr:glycosyltransferase family 1 protein [Chloroflexota bacterium]|tara:strand:- start:2975 stop:3949 length:975 start_codon:yes stop_codon:yes gene_type:complete
MAGYPDIEIDHMEPPASLRGQVGKLIWEQVVWPTRSRGRLGHVPYLAPPVFGQRFVVTAHDVIPFVLPEYATGTRQAAYLAVTRAGLKNASKVIADSESTRRDLIRVGAVSDDKIVVIPLGVDDRFAPGTESQRECARQRLGLPGNFALFLGTRDLRKNLEVVLSAWPEIWKRSGLSLVIAGRAPKAGGSVYVDWFADLDQSATAWLRVIGPVSERDKPDLYRASNMFVFPSRYEGFGLDPLEAMASGVPVLVADCTSLPEVVGDAGLLLPPDKPAAWRDAVCRVAQDRHLASDLHGKGLARAAGFTWARTAELTYAVYQEVGV